MKLIGDKLDTKKFSKKLIIFYPFSRILFGVGLGIFFVYLFKLHLLWSVVFFVLAIILSIPFRSIDPNFCGKKKN